MVLILKGILKMKTIFKRFLCIALIFGFILPYVPNKQAQAAEVKLQKIPLTMTKSCRTQKVRQLFIIL